MAAVNYYSHVPMIRIAEESRPLGPGHLWRLPFDAWNAQTATAFADHRKAYEQTSPVFFYIEAEVDWPILVSGKLEKQSFIELKKPSYRADKKFEDLGFGFLTGFQKTLGRTAQAALTLAAPAAAPGSLRSSMTICVPDDHYFKIGSQTGSLARIQGDADHEWLLLPAASGPPLDAEIVDFASALWGFAQQVSDQNEELGGALNSLLLCAESTLTPLDQLVLATIALEALLLPEIRSQLKSTFARRLAVLLGGHHDADSVEHDARILYEARSAALHGSEPKDIEAAEAMVGGCGAQQYLAAAILALGPSVFSGVSLTEIRARLDEGSAPEDAVPTRSFDFKAPAGLRRSRRLEHRTPTSSPSTLVSGGVMHAEEGDVLSWSPLLGLGCDETIGVSEGDFAVVSVNAVELVELEERDIRRDFIGEMRARHGIGAFPPDSIACIGLFDRGQYNLGHLEQGRELAVAVLRLAGFSRFIDPRLLGWFINEGNRRYRIPTVLRQSVLTSMAQPPEQRISGTDRPRLEELAALLVTYRRDRPNDQIEEVIGEFLRAHPTDFLPGEASASMLYGVLEQVLGRFRHPRAAIQLEDLVYTVTKSDESTWFSTRGRKFRNSVAHGRWDPDLSKGDTKSLLAVVRQVIETLIRFVNDSDETSASPCRSFVDYLEARVAK